MTCGQWRQPGSIEQLRIELAWKDIPARTMILFLVKPGLRRGELIAMDLKDLNLEKGEFRVRAPKAKRSNRLGFMDGELTAAPREYLDWCEEILHGNSQGTQEALWITPGGARISSEGGLIPNRNIILI